MSITSEFIARLNQPGTPFRIVEGAASIPNVNDRPNASPAVYVLIVEQSSGDNELATGPVLQLSEIDVALVIITENVSDDQMAAAADDMESLTAFARAQLIGWRPSAAETPVEHVSGKILKARGGAVWFEDRFTTTVYLEGI